MHTWCSLSKYPLRNPLPNSLYFAGEIQDACRGGSAVASVEQYCNEGYEGPREYDTSSLIRLVGIAFGLVCMVFHPSAPPCFAGWMGRTASDALKIVAAVLLQREGRPSIHSVFRPAPLSPRMMLISTRFRRGLELAIRQANGGVVSPPLPTPAVHDHGGGRLCQSAPSAPPATGVA